MNDEKIKDNKELIIYSKYDDIISLCNKEHLKTCSCQDKLKNEFKLQLIEEYKIKLDFVKQSSDSEYEEMKEAMKYRMPDEILKRTSEYCVTNVIRCPIEKQEIKNTIELFNMKYDLNDSRVYMILKSVLNFQLSAFRMQRYSNYYGILQEVFDRNGNRAILLNPVEESKRKFDEAIISAIEKLDKIIEGDKSVNLNIGANFTDLIINAYSKRVN